MKISVIIPALNEEDFISSAIDSAAASPDAQIIVADGGSVDNTVAKALENGATVVSSPTGRAKQMNNAAFAASGEILLFLHADTRLPHGYAEQAREILAGGDIAAGAFELAVDSPVWGMRIIERLANWRSRVLQLPYGDQAFFMKSDTFKMIGGFPDIPIMEDYELMKRLRRHGKIAIAPSRAQTSARRWKRAGIIKTTLINQAVIIAYKLGVAPSEIALKKQALTR